MTNDAYPLPTDDLPALVDRAVALLKSLGTQSPVVAYSGGKDSTVVLHLCRRAGLRPQPIYHVTTIDPPELVRFVRTQGAWFDNPGQNYARLIADHGLPTMWHRWCCRIFKHGRTFADITVLGVRAAESFRRRKSWTASTQTTSRGTLILPILRWEDHHVWRYIAENNIPLCCLYSQGYTRVGCIGCPLSRGSRIQDFIRWPRFAAQIRDGFVAYARTHKVEDPPNFWHRWVHDEFQRPNHHAECSGVALWANR